MDYEKYEFPNPLFYIIRLSWDVPLTFSEFPNPLFYIIRLSWDVTLTFSD